MTTIENIVKETKNINDLIALIYIFEITNNNYGLNLAILKLNNYFFATSKFDNYTENNIFKITDLIVKYKHQEIMEDYNDIIKEYSHLANSLGLKTPMELCIFSQFILDEGYLSFDHKSKFENESNLKERYGQLLLMHGIGVCHNHAAFLNDFLNYNNISSCVNLGYMRTEDKKQPRNQKENHTTILIKETAYDYLYDITNNTIFFKYDSKHYASISTKYLYKEQYDRKAKPLTDTQFEDLISHYFETKERVHDLLQNNIEQVEQSYQRIYNNIENINEYILRREK